MTCQRRGKRNEIQELKKENNIIIIMSKLIIKVEKKPSI